MAKGQNNSDKDKGGSPFYRLLAAADKTYGNLPINIKLIVQQVSKAIPEFGPRKLRKRGPGTEFYEARDYKPEIDSPNKINARLTGKTGRNMVVEMEAEISQRIYLWRDPSESMEFASSDKVHTKKEAAEIMLLAFARHLTKNEEVVGVVDRSGLHRGGRAAESLAQKLFDVRVITGELPILRSRPPRNSTAILFSDFITDTDKIAKNLDHLKSLGLSGHIVMVLDPQEVDFEVKGHIEFTGLKGEVSQTFQKAQKRRDDYRNNLADHIEKVSEIAKARGFNFIFQRTDEPLHYGLMQIYKMPAKEHTANPLPDLRGQLKPK